MVTAESVLYGRLALGVCTAAIAALLFLLFISAPYGRHARQGWGPTIPGRLAWVLMECPSVVAFAAIYALGTRAWTPIPLLFCALWQLHYVHRTFVYSVRLRAPPRMPVLVVVVGAAFNVVNSYLNARWISEFGQYSIAWLIDLRLLCGLALFGAGMVVNRRADAVLARLKSLGGGYGIPHGGMYRWVSCPNYFGELVEWTGWALMTWSVGGLTFLVFTAANLVPRALTNHRWYHATFPEYPKERRALLPLLL